ncbi:MAG: hypothetical protein KDD22_01600 [Bdellovibrionales bacterium]|nr:hypothetical protein [Bdellovibrionales bacterium]
MNKSRRSILGILSLMPFSSVAFAQDFSCLMGSNRTFGDNDTNYEGEMMRRLNEGTLSPKYYDFLERHQVPDYESLETPEYSRHRNRLTREFISDIYTRGQVAAMSSGALSGIPPK